MNVGVRVKEEVIIGGREVRFKDFVGIKKQSFFRIGGGVEMRADVSFAEVIRKRDADEALFFGEAMATADNFSLKFIFRVFIIEINAMREINEG